MDQDAIQNLLSNKQYIISSVAQLLQLLLESWTSHWFSTSIHEWLVKTKWLVECTSDWQQFIFPLNRPYAYDVTEGRPAALGSNVALPRAPSPSMQPEGQPLHAIPPGWPGPAHWLRGWAPMRSASTTRARSATSLDPQHGVVVMETWRQCIRSISEFCVGFNFVLFNVTNTWLIWLIHH